MYKNNSKKLIILFVPIFLLALSVAFFFHSFFHSNNINMTLAEEEKSINFQAPSIYQNNITVNAIKVRNIGNSYQIVLSDGYPVVVKPGDFVLLDTNESLFITFAKHGRDNEANVTLQTLVDENNKGEIGYNVTNSLGYNFLTGSTQIAYLDVSAKLNNQNYNISTFQLNTTEINSRVNFGSSGSTNYEFGYILSGNDLLENYGKFDFTFNFMTKETSNLYGDDVSNVSTINFSFFAFETSYYLDAKPTLSNYSSLGVTNTYYDTSYLFNFTNSAYIGEEIKLPSYTFNSEKYILGYSKIYAGKTQTYHNVGETGLAGEKKLTLSELGDYDITKQMIYVLDGVVYECTNLNVKPDKLYIYGYIPYYSAINSERKDKFYSDNLITDFTNYNLLINGQDENYLNISYNSNDYHIDPDSFTNVQSTNLAPVWFDYYATFTENSKVFFQSSDIGANGEFVESQFENQKFSNNGRYIVYVEYTFESSTNVKYQLFCFDIKNATPEVNLLYTENETDKLLDSGSFINKNVRLQFDKLSIFDSPIKISYILNSDLSNKNFTGNGAQITNFVTSQDGNKLIYEFNQDGNYKIKIEYGYNYLENYEIFFTIDTKPISNIHTYAVKESIDNAGNSVQIRDNSIDLTNDYLSCTPFVLQWDKKESGANITVYMKYIPFVNSNSITSRSIDGNYIIDSGYTTISLVEGKDNFDIFEYKNNRQYLNGVQSTNQYITVDPSSVISSSGIYIFYFEDDAGNNTYFSKIIDKSQANVQAYMKDGDIYVSDNYIKASDSYQVVSEDKKYYFGTHKSIQLDNSILNDEWFKKVYSLNEQLYNKNYSNIYYISGNGVGDYNAILVPIKTVDIYSKASGVYEDESGNILSQEDILVHIDVNKNADSYYSYELISDLGERTYTFYINDQSNSLYSYSSLSQTFTVDGGNTKIFRAEVNFDKSQGNILQNENVISTTQTEEESADAFNNRLYKNYTSSAINNEIQTFYYATSKHALQFIWKDNIDIGGNALSIANLVYKYYPIQFDEDKKTYYYSETPSVFSGSDFTDYITAMADVSFGSYNISEIINPEPYILNNQYIGQKTKAGKYEIIRTYNSENINIIPAKDSLTRVYTFYVDDNGIVSSPNFDSAGNLTYREVGDYLKLILGSSTKINFKEFQKIYNSSDSGDFVNILNTNYLPVEVSIPYFKYGYTVSKLFTNTGLNIVAGLDLVYDDYNVLQTINKLSDLYSYNLSINIEYSSASTSSSSVDKKFYKSVLKINGMSEKDTFGNLKIYESNSMGQIINTNSISSFNLPGTYRVVIYDFLGDYNASNNQYDLNSNKIQFSFTIESEKPQGEFYELENNKTINQISNIENLNYTNYTSVRYMFTDPNDIYKAKIDLNNVYYKLSANESYRKVNVQTSSSNPQLHYFDITVNTSYLNEPIPVYVKVQYEGNKEDYKDSNNNYYFEGESFVYIDLKAPVTNIEKLINADKFIKLVQNNVYTRDIGDRYNVSTLNTESFFYEYAFAVDKNFTFTRKNGSGLYNDTYAIYLRKYNKYQYNEAGVLQKEYLSPTNPNSGSANLFNSNITFNDGSGLAYWIVGTNDLYNGEITLYDFASIWWSGDVESYYEIVEMDRAGNITIYTVFLTDESVNLDVVKGNADSSTENINLTIENNKESIYAINQFSIQSSLDNAISINNDYWYQLIVTVGGADYKFYHTPSLNKNSYYNSNFQVIQLSEINNLFIKNVVMNITLKSRLSTDDFIINVSIADSTSEFIISDIFEENGKLVLRASKNQFIKPQEIKLYVRNNDAWQQVEFDGTYSSNIEYVYKSVVDGVQNQVYKISVIDYYNRTLEYPYIFGDDTVTKQYVYENQEISSYLYNGNYYTLTSGDIYLIFNNNYYDERNGISLEKVNANGQWENVTPIITNYYDNGIFISNVKRLTIQKPLFENKISYTGGVYKYRLSLTNCLNETEDYKYFMIYNRLPNITITDDNNLDKSGIVSVGSNISSQTTSKPVYISYRDVFNDIDVNFKSTVIIKAPNLNGEYEEITLQENKIESFSYKGTYFILISLENLNFGRSETINPASFVISDNETNMYDVFVYDDNTTYLDMTKINSENIKYTYNGKQINHYITNKNYHDIKVNAEKNLNVQSVEHFAVGEVVTNIYKIYSQYYETYIAVSYIPKSTDILVNGFDYTTISQSLEVVSGNRLTTNSITLSGKTPNFESEDNLIDESSTIFVHFPKYYLTSFNTISVTIYCNGKQLQNPLLLENDSKTRYEFALSETGIYTFQFEDRAGNKHQFTTTSENSEDLNIYTIRYFNSVIVKINEEEALPYKIFNDKVQVTIDNDYYKIYNTNPKPEFIVYRNGVQLDSSQISEAKKLVDDENIINDSSIILTDIGYYEVYITGSITLNGKLYKLDTPIYTFLILDEEESRRAFEFVSLDNYEITKIIKDSVDVTDAYKENGKILKFYTYLSEDTQDARGTYQLTIRYLGTDYIDQQEFNVKFKINTASPVITSSISKGESTTKKITISFNPNNLYNELGSCKVIIKSGGTVYGEYNINKDTLSEYGDIITKELTSNTTYYVQVLTASGDIVDSFKVVKKEPLNTVAILLIVGGSLLVVGGGVLFFFLRRRMRVK